MIYNIVALLCGILFGCGLTISQMVNANKILNFLDITGNWDPSLALVMLSAIVITWLGYQLVNQSTQPKLAEKFFLPDKTSFDTRLILGSALFGIGWGFAGYCPGPAISALGLGIMDAIYFVLGMIASVVIYQLFFVIFKYITKPDY
jgi:uncharacterized protein